METYAIEYSPDFKSLWDSSSNMGVIWDQTGALFHALDGFLDELEVVIASYRTLKEIEIDMAGNLHGEKQPMEYLYLESLRVVWSRLLLRTLQKVLDSMRVVFASANSSNLYGCALGARGVLEHVALLQYFADKAPWLKKAAVEMKDAIPFTRELFQLTFASRFDWNSLYNGQIRQLVQTGAWNRPHDERIPHIATLVDGLEKAMKGRSRIQYDKEIGFYYTLLCDVVHPSWGGDFLYTRDMYRDPETDSEQVDQFKLASVLICGGLANLLGFYVKMHLELSEKIPDVIVRLRPDSDSP